MNKEEILKQVAFDLNKAKQIHQWLNEAPENGAQASETRKPVSIHYGEDGKPDGILIQSLDDAFILDLHDKGEMTYNEAEKYDLPDVKMARLYGLYLNEVNEVLDEAGGDRLEDDYYWTKTPAEEVFGASSVSTQLIFIGTLGTLYTYYPRFDYARVRVARRF